MRVARSALLAGLMAALLAVASCQSAPGAGAVMTADPRFRTRTGEPTVAPAPGMSVAEAETVAIYATVIRRLCTRDDSFGGTFKPATVYLVRRTDDKAADPMATPGAPVTLSVAVQGGIVAALGDLPARLIWVDSFEVVPRDAATGAVAGHGVIVTLGNIVPQEGGTVHVPASIYVASLAAAGQTYVLQKENGVWTVKGNTGVQWMS